MAKRRQTTGQPKLRKKTTAASEERESGKLKRQYQSHAEREEAYQRMLIWAIAGILTVIIIVLAVAFIKDKLIDPKRTVATVNGQDITVQDFQDRVRFERLLIIERIDAQIDSLVDAGYTNDRIDAANQLYQFDSTFRTALESIDPSSSDLLGFQVINDMIDDALIRQEAENQGITVNQEDVEAQIRAVLYSDLDLTPQIDGSDGEAAPENTPEPPTPTPTPFVSPTPMPEPTAMETPDVEAPPLEEDETPIVPTAQPTQNVEEKLAAFDKKLDVFYNRANSEANMSRDDVYAYFETRALRKALSNVVVETSTTSVWVNARHILVETETQARDIIEALNNGESFADLARINSIDTGSGENGGELDWQDVDNYVEEFSQAVRALPIGEISEPVQSQFGFHIIQVRERENRDLDASYVDYNREQDFMAWVDTLREREENDYAIQSDVWVNYVPQTPIWTLR